MIKNFIIFSFLLLYTQVSAASEQLREIEFTVYGQYPVRDVIYNPVQSNELPDSDPIKIETHILNRKGPYNFKGNDVIQFYDQTTNENVGTVRLSQDSSKWLLIFVKNPHYSKNSPDRRKYLIYPFDDSMQNLTLNSLVFLNISGKELDGFLENKRIKLTSGESTPYSVQESLPINLWTRGFDGERLLQALVKTYRFEKDRRYLMIFFPPVLRGSGDLDVRVLDDEGR
jgi:hypothetical protein